MRQRNLGSALHLIVPVPVQLCRTAARLCVEAQHKQIRPPVFIEVARGKLAVACRHQFDNLAVFQRIGAHRLQHLIGQLPADQNLLSCLAVEVHIFHARKRRAVSLDDRNVLIRAVLFVKDVSLEWLFSRGPGKDDCLFLPVTVEIDKLHRLLVAAGDRRAVGAAVRCHHLVDCHLQIVIFIGVPGQRIQLVDRLDKAAGKQQAQRARQQNRRKSSQFQRPVPPLHNISVHCITNCYGCVALL